MSETDSSKPQFVHVSYIATTPEKLWAALTSPEFTQRYWGGLRLESDWRVGSPIKVLKPGNRDNWQGEILRHEPPRVLAYTFMHPGTPQEPPSRVTFEIDVAWGVTRLTVTHDRFAADSQSRAMVTQGWHAILSNLKTLLETGNTLPFTWKG